MWFEKNSRPKTVDAMDFVAHQRRLKTAETLHCTPRPPVLRSECLFFDAAYSTVVARRRRSLLDADATRRKHLLTSIENDLRGFRLHQEERQKCQEMWLIIINLVGFMKLHTMANEVMALATLRRVFGPIVYRVSMKKRKMLRLKLLALEFADTMKPLNVDSLRAFPAFSGWCDRHIARIIPKFTIQGVTDGMILVPEATSHGDLYILDNGQVEICCRQRSWDPKRKRGEDLFTIIGTVSPGESFGELGLFWEKPSRVAYRARGRRVLCWKLANEVYHEALKLVSPEEISQRPKLLMELRRKEMSLLLYPAPEALQNCGQNTLFRNWNPVQLKQLIQCLKPVCFSSGETIFHENEPCTSMLFVAEGCVSLIAHRQIFSRSVNVAHSGRLAVTRPTTQQTIVHYEGPWFCIGQGSIVTQDPRRTTAVARTDVDGWLCSRNDLMQQLLSDPRLHLAVKSAISEIKEQYLVEDGTAELRVMLKRDPIFSFLTQETISAIISHAKPRWFSASESMIDTSLPASILVITKGFVRVRPTAVKTADDCPGQVGPGCVCAAGASVLGENWSFHFTLESISQVDAWEIPGSSVHKAIRATCGKEAERVWRKLADLAQERHTEGLFVP